MSTQSAGTSLQMSSSSYVLPIEDLDFLPCGSRSSMRRQDLILRDWRIRSTIIVFGSARVPSPEVLDM